jgi:hypothetical protein
MGIGRPPDPFSKLKCEVGENDGRVGTWPHERPLQMDRKFVERLERAIARGDERLGRRCTGRAAVHRPHTLSGTRYSCAANADD